MSNKPVLYFAAPLFSEAELTFNKAVALRLESFFDVYLPQEDGGLLVEMVGKGMTADAASRAVFGIDIRVIDRCDLVLIVLDGRSIDEGAAFELGYAYAKGKVCYGLQTDPRRLLPVGNNPMVACALKGVFTSVSDLVAWAASGSPPEAVVRVQQLWRR
jgi:nucleoside 2-deoxyribosyltransferase